MPTQKWESFFFIIVPASNERKQKMDIRGKMKKERVRILKEGSQEPGPVVYWMSRDQRVSDNWALIFSQHLALQKKSPLVVMFCLVPEFLGATIRQYDFMLKGLQEAQKDLSVKAIPFILLQGLPEYEIPKFIIRMRISTLVMDFDPLRVKRGWKNSVIEEVSVPVYEVDAHNIVPCWVASPKREFAAYTFRPKVKRQLSDFLDHIPSLKKHPFPSNKKNAQINWNTVEANINVDRSVPQVDWLEPGQKAAHQILDQFVSQKLSSYDKNRNDPNKDGQSHLSPYLHFGQISAQRVALEIQERTTSVKDQVAFLEELIVRRELSDNFCFYDQHYDDFQGFPDWAEKTLHEHRKDKREYLYSLEQLEMAQTHDELWNASQTEMIKSGKMHGYLRMYWAKKILEWTESPEEALNRAIFLNDKYELDGRDPNGYTGIAWAIGGVHDRAWFPRPIFGKIRYMSFKGAQSKFDVKTYISRVNEI
jgi:deoxyribodipyrimidine photo-lyase